MGSYLRQMQDKVKKGRDVFIAHNATVLGDVTLGDEVSIWFGAVLRADWNTIEIGDRTNVQENVIFHVDHYAPVKVGEDNIIGHGSIIHGCTIGHRNLVGMRATVMNNAKIGNNCVIGAHALVTENMVVPDNSLVLGIPGKVVRQVPEEIGEKIKYGASLYVEEASKYLK